MLIPMGLTMDQEPRPIEVNGLPEFAPGGAITVTVRVFDTDEDRVHEMELRGVLFETVTGDATPVERELLERIVPAHEAAQEARPGRRLR